MIRIVRASIAALGLLAGLGVANADATKDLWAALKGANDPAALAAIKKGVDVNKTDGIMGTPLQLAACFSGPEVVKALIDAKSNVNFVEPASGNTPLISALTWGNLEAAKLLIAAGANPKAATKYTNTLWAAISSSKAAVVKLVLDAGMKPSDRLLVGTAPFTPWALFMERGLSPAENVARFKKDQLPFLTNVLHVTAPAWVMNQTEASFTPLDEMAKLLITAGANVDEDQPGLGSMLFIAARRGKLEVVKTLIEAKAKLESRSFVSGAYASHMVTPLMIAALNGHTAVVEALADAGADVNAKSVQHTVATTSNSTSGYTTTNTWYTNTALSLAAAEKHADTVAALLKRGAQPPTK